MSKYIKKATYKTVAAGSEGNVDISAFTELTAGSERKGDIGITETDGSYRVVFYSSILSILGNNRSVKVYLVDAMIAIKPVSSDMPGAFEICKGGILYSSNLAEQIMSLNSEIDFIPRHTTRCGRIIEVQSDEDDTPTIIVKFD